MPRMDTRYERLDAIERALARAPDGLTSGELAREFCVDPDTIRRDLAELEMRGTGLLKHGRRYQLDHRRQLHSVKLDQHEVMGLYLAARLLLRYSDEQNPHVARALEKLADALGAKAPLIARHIAQAATGVRGKPARDEYISALETLTQAWSEGRKIRLAYRSGQGEVTERVFAPYFIEPSAIGYTCYAIGYDELRGQLRTLKVERIVRAALTEERFQAPAQFDPTELLQSAWGIMWQEDGETEVQLHFRADVVPRLKESIWHHTQRLEDLPDGSCRFTVRVGSPVELRPWIRQWGSAVTVISPPALRQEIAADARRMAAQYADG